MATNYDEDERKATSSNVDSIESQKSERPNEDFTENVKYKKRGIILKRRKSEESELSKKITQIVDSISAGGTKNDSSFSAGRTKSETEKSHVAPNPRDETKSFVCEVCEKTFPANWRLVRHSVVHSGVVKFVRTKRPAEAGSSSDANTSRRSARTRTSRSITLTNSSDKSNNQVATHIQSKRINQSNSINAKSTDVQQKSTSIPETLRFYQEKEDSNDDQFIWQVSVATEEITTDEFDVNNLEAESFDQQVDEIGFHPTHSLPVKRLEIRRGPQRHQ